MKKSDQLWSYAAERFSRSSGGSCQVCIHGGRYGGQCSFYEGAHRYTDPDEHGACPVGRCGFNDDGKCIHPWHPANVDETDLLLEAL